MVNVTFHNGPHAGNTVNVAGLEPKKLFATMVEEDWKWSLDFTRIPLTEEEIWKNWDFIARCGRALKKGRLVTFKGVHYEDLDELPALEKTIMDSPRNVVILSEDDDGIKIGPGNFKVH